MKELMLHKINEDRWEVWEEGDKESDDLNKKEVLKLIASRLKEQKELSVLCIGS